MATSRDPVLAYDNGLYLALSSLAIVGTSLAQLNRSQEWHGPGARASGLHAWVSIAAALLFFHKPRDTKSWRPGWVTAVDSRGMARRSQGRERGNLLLTCGLILLLSQAADDNPGA